MAVLTDKWQKVRENVGGVIYLLFGVFIFGVALIGTIMLVSPTVMTMTTTHTVPYLPANYEVVEGVTNVFSETTALGGAGGVGFPQVERSLKAYREHEREGVVHYVAISPGEITIIDYYDIQAEKVIHANIRARTTSPSWKRWGVVFGYYKPIGGTIDECQLVLERSFESNFNTALLFIFVAAPGLTLYHIVVKYVLSPFVIDRVFQRLSGKK